MMAQPKRSEIDARDYAATKPSRARPTADLTDAQPHESPALKLMEHAARSLGQETERKWSARRTLAFVTIASTGLWAIIASTAYVALH